MRALWSAIFEEARRAMDEAMTWLGPGEAVAEVVDSEIDLGDRRLPIRRYRPAALAAGPAPTLVFFHGGAFVLGGLVSHDRDCRALANHAACQVIAVDYRLAPRHPFPAAPEDAMAALVHVVEHADLLGVDPARVAVGGDSAGGNLAAVAALHARDLGIPLRLQLLIYPFVDGEVPDEAQRYPSRSADDGNRAVAAAMDWLTAHYFPTGMPNGDWRAAPMQAPSHAGVAPAFIVTAELDPLRDEGEAYARVLTAAGVDATVVRHAGMVHGSLTLAPFVPQARRAIAEMGAALRAAFGSDVRR